jgi:hypothetical protein
MWRDRFLAVSQMASPAAVQLLWFMAWVAILVVGCESITTCRLAVFIIAGGICSGILRRRALIQIFSRLAVTLTYLLTELKTNKRI